MFPSESTRLESGEPRPDGFMPAALSGPAEAYRIRATSLYRETDSDAHAEDVWHVRYDGQDFRDG